MTDPENTTAEMLLTAADIGRANGLRYVYAGNLPGSVGDLEDTRCASCGELLVARYGYHIRDYRLTPDGRCPSCATPVPGRWSPQFDGQITSRPFVPWLAGWFTILNSLMNDLLGRPLRNLRLSVTDRCNLRCEYCMPEDDYVWLPREDVLHFEETSALVDVFLSLGVDKVRLTGGEPLLRRDLPALVRMIAAKPGLNDLALTTNGVLLADQVDALKAAGLGRITVSLDTLQPRSLREAHALRPARGRPRRHRGGASRLRPPQDRHRRHPRRQRRRARAARSSTGDR